MISDVGTAYLILLAMTLGLILRKVTIDRILGK
jgi:hypothetical protein